MTMLTLWTDGFDMATIEGDIELTKYNNITNDFKLKLRKSSIKLIDPTTLIFVEAAETTDWSWLKDLPITEIEINGKSITPVWKPNKYGEPADTNDFQKVTIDNDTISISVSAEGTEEEVFKRYSPYLIRGTNKYHDIDYNHKYLTQDEYEARQVADTFEEVSEDVISNLFE